MRSGTVVSLFVFANKWRSTGGFFVLSSSKKLQIKLCKDSKFLSVKGVHSHTEGKSHQRNNYQVSIFTKRMKRLKRVFDALNGSYPINIISKSKFYYIYNRPITTRTFKTLICIWYYNLFECILNLEILSYWIFTTSHFDWTVTIFHRLIKVFIGLIIVSTTNSFWDKWF